MKHEVQVTAEEYEAIRRIQDEADLDDWQKARKICDLLGLKIEDMAFTETMLQIVPYVWRRWKRIP